MSDLDQCKTLAKIAVSSGSYTGMTEFTIINLMMSAQALGINPYEALNSGFHIISGKLVMTTAMMAARIRRDGHSIKITEWTRDKCVIVGLRKDNQDSLKVEFSWDDAIDAKLTEREMWKKYRKQMLYNRAMSNLARVLFPDIIGNCYCPDEGDDIQRKKPEDCPVREICEEDLEVTLHEEKKRPSIHSLEDLISAVEGYDLPSVELGAFVDTIAQRKGSKVEDVIDSAMVPELQSKFLSLYKKYLADVAA